MVDALGFYGQVALLKGRSNYLCLDRLSRQMIESHGTHTDPTLLAQLVKVRSWSSATQTGDRAIVMILLKIAQLFQPLLRLTTTA